MRVNVRLLAIYAFTLVIMYLAGAYFGNILHILFVFFCILPVFSFIALLIWSAGVSVKQEFSTHMPVKGDAFSYELIIFNKSFLPIPSVKVNFKTVSPSLEVEMPSYTVGVEPGRIIKKLFRIRCPYRGVYEIGAVSLEIHDFFQLFSIRKKTQPGKFIVYPRIIELDEFSEIGSVAEGTARNASVGLLPDPTLFQQLKEYRDGDPIRHIYWKKYASIGRPVLKEYDHTRSAGVRIYFDTRKNNLRKINELEQEDVSVEILVALVKFLLDRSIHTSVVAPGWQSGEISSQEKGVFDDFYKATINLRFTDTVSPVSPYYEDRSAGNLESQIVLFITHLIDPAIFALREHAREHELRFISNCASYIRQDMLKIQELMDSIRDYGASGLCVRGGDSIREDLRDRVFETV
jgi:uncharacterized protein (DUF58 family)